MKTAIICCIILLAWVVDQPRKAWYTVRFQSLCDELERNVTPERATRFGKLQAYNLKQENTAPDTVLVSFDFISNCCETHTGAAEIVDSTLTLNYYQTGAEACRCLCDYRLTYSISDTTLHWRSIAVERIEKKK